MGRKGGWRWTSGKESRKGGKGKMGVGERGVWKEVEGRGGGGEGESRREGGGGG